MENTDNLNFEVKCNSYYEVSYSLKGIIWKLIILVIQEINYSYQIALNFIWIEILVYDIGTLKLIDIFQILLKD